MLHCALGLDDLPLVSDFEDDNRSKQTTGQTTGQAGKRRSEWPVRVFVYEFVTGGGCYTWPASPIPDGSLLTEGAAMLAAVRDDLSACGHQVLTLVDGRLAEGEFSVDSCSRERSLFMKLASDADGVMVIAPEMGDALAQRAQWVLEAGGRLLSPSPELIRLAADKDHCCKILEHAGLATPRRYEPCSPNAGAWPVISKPNDGCGSLRLAVLSSIAEANRHVTRGRRVEHLVSGWPASVAVLCGPQGLIPLEACEQHLRPTGLGYLGGALPLSKSGWADRAKNTAVQAVAALLSDSDAAAAGFLGVDLIVSDKHTVVIEINPRFTTSYVGLRKYYGCAEVDETNAGRPRLAEALLQLAQGAAVSSVSLQPAVDGVWWTASGYWEPLSACRGDERS